MEGLRLEPQTHAPAAPPAGAAIARSKEVNERRRIAGNHDGATKHSAVASAGAPDARASASGFHPFSLDALNFLASDVRGAVGPYLNVFLVTQQQWSQSQVGLVTMIAGLCGLAVQTPVGAAIDETRSKRGVIVLALAVLAITALVIFAWPVFWPVLIANSLMAVAGDVFGPAVAALTLGLYSRKQLARRMGGTRPSTMPAMSGSPWWRALSAMPSRSAPFSCWCLFSPC